VVSALKPHNRS